MGNPNFSCTQEKRKWDLLLYKLHKEERLIWAHRFLGDFSLLWLRRHSGRASQSRSMGMRGSWSRHGSRQEVENEPGSGVGQ